MKNDNELEYQSVPDPSVPGGCQNVRVWRPGWISKTIGWILTAAIVKDAATKIIANPDPGNIIASVLVGLFFFTFVYMFLFMNKRDPSDSEWEEMTNPNSIHYIHKR